MSIVGKSNVVPHPSTLQRGTDVVNTKTGTKGYVEKDYGDHVAVRVEYTAVVGFEGSYRMSYISATRYWVKRHVEVLGTVVDW